MIPRPPWFERRFVFDLPITAAAGLVERLRGTPARVEDRVRGLPEERRIRRLGDRWSIQENVGHLWDLEPLWMGRVDDLAAGRPTLRAADLSNRATNEAGHHARPLLELTEGFRAARRRLIERLEASEEAAWARAAQHPRLGTDMRLLDLAFFVAEHDDHHLANITDLLRRFGAGGEA